MLNLLLIRKMRIIPDNINFGLHSIGSSDKTEGELAITNSSRDVWLEFFGLSHEFPKIDPISHSDELQLDLANKPTFDQLAVNVKRARIRLRVVLRDKALTSGNHFERLVIRAQGIPAHEVMVVWQVVGPLVVSPSNLYFGTVTPGGLPQVKRVIITATNKTLFRLTHIESGSPNLTNDRFKDLGPVRSPSLMHIVELTLSPPATNAAGALSGNVRFVTDLPGESSISVPWATYMTPANAMIEKTRESPTRSRGD